MGNSFEKQPAPDKQPKKREAPIGRVLMSKKEDGEFWEEQFAKRFKMSKQYVQEKEKTESEKSIIKGLNEKMKEFAERYGGQHVDVSERRIHIADPEKLTKEDWENIKKRHKGNSAAIYDMGDQSIKVMMVKHEDDVDLADALAHELIHMDGFHSVQAQWTDDSKQEANIYPRRMGLSTYESFKQDKPEIDIYFKKLEEALAEELANHFAEEYFPQIPELKEGLDLRKEIAQKKKKKGEDVKYLTDISVRAWQQEDGSWKTSIAEVEEYKKEREYLEKLVGQLYEKNKDQFSSKEEVFAEFAKMHYTGKMLPLARLIERTMGKGHFRKIAEETKETEPKEELIF